MWRLRLVYWGGAAAVAVLTAGYARLAREAEATYRAGLELDPGVGWLLPAVTLPLIGWLVARLAPAAAGSGAPQAMAALVVADERARARLLAPRVVAAKIGLGAAALAGGAAAGIFAPSVQIGAATMQAVGRHAGLAGRRAERGLVLAGAAAGIAASFGAPLAGIVFAMEEMARSFEERANALLLTAVVLAGLVTVAMGWDATRGMPQLPDPVGTLWLAVPALGVGGGILGGLVALVLVSALQGLEGIPPRRRLAVATVCGLVVGTAALATGGEAVGTGLTEIEQLLAGGEAAPLLALWKLLAATATALSGVPGGLIGPGLAVGGALGHGLAPLLPAVPPPLLVVVGMGGFVAGLLQSPLTVLVIVLEVADHHALVPPLMTTVFLAYGASRLVCDRPLYRALARGLAHQGRA
ncbi:chloride channel protein [Inmirania thermothiophila]|uniref:chloride channel protein n=1 Tax=Inmirania thermothiophila TaxID=1750597 RepID=UPI001475B32B|nr:chloride channel protein [Inmirania thermothiophila]